jgi:ABC-type branched-subunit amino acid transport system ATPase component
LASDNLLELRDIEAGYGRAAKVLRGLTVTVPAGTVVCLVGPNGAGKSTVLRTISGLLPCKRGEIVFEGKSIEGLGCDAILRMGVAQVPQQDALFPAMSIKENVMLGGYAIRRQRALVKKRYEAVEELVPWIKDRASERAGNLSGGQRRMIEIGRSLMLEPKLLLLDEPSLGLDPKSLAQVADLISLANAQGRTILLVEQNVKLGLSMASHGVVMEAGRIRLEGDPDAILASPEIASLYLGGSIEEPSSEVAKLVPGERRRAES